MSAFTDQIAADRSAFLPLTGGRGAEFDAARVIDGAPVAGSILDDDARAQDPITGVYLSQSVLHVRTEDLAAVPVITQVMTIDGRKGRVVHVDETMGMLSVRLEWFES